MANPTVETPEETEVRTIAAQIAALDIELLVYPKEGATFIFEEHRRFFESIINFYSDVGGTNLRYIPTHLLQIIARAAKEVLSSLNAIREFNIRRGDPNSLMRDLVANLRNQWNEAYAQSASHIALARVSSGAITDDLRKLQGFIDSVAAKWSATSDEYKKFKETTDAQLKERFAEFEKVISAAREASGKEAVSRQASEFEIEANKCLKASRLWFAATVIMVATSLIVVYCMFLKGASSPQLAKQTTHAVGTNSVATNQLPVAAIAAISNETLPMNHTVTIEVLQQTVARILIVTLLYSMVVWVARNYFANRHNYTVNRHRRNAMQTFRAFVEGTKDLATQDFILRQAAACAFAPQQTGYLKDEELPTPAPSSQFVDISKPGNS